MKKHIEIMFKAKLKHKKNGDIVICRVFFDKERNAIYYNPDDPRETYNVEDYDKMPLEPYELFGVECGEGWKDLYNPIFKYIEEYNKDKSEENKIIPLQVKEKFAHLEFYTNFQTKELREMIENAQIESENTCEKCGSKEDVGMVIGGYYYTTCFKCLIEEIKHNNGEIKCWHRNLDNKNYWVDENGNKEHLKENLP